MPGPILRELKSHAPFTLMGALTGIALLLLILITRVNVKVLEPAFHSFHAVHVFLSALVTAGMYRRYRKGIVAAVLIGFVGSVGIASLSDVIFPHHGGAFVLRLAAEPHHMHFHLPAIEQWWLIGPVALLGVAMGIWKPTTKMPHSGHVLLSTWASLFYLLVHASGEVNWIPLLPLVFVVLFVAVWLPCCVSDIVFPLLFVGEEAIGHDHDHPHGGAGTTKGDSEDGGGLS